MPSEGNLSAPMDTDPTEGWRPSAVSLPLPFFSLIFLTSSCHVALANCRLP